MTSAPTAIRGYGPFDYPLELPAETGDREGETEALLQEWFEALAETIPSPGAHEQVYDWLRIQAQIPYASARNAVLLLFQAPDASHLATYDWWAEQNSTILHNESAIWLWEPIIARVCPGCGEAYYNHDHDDETSIPDCAALPPVEWDYAKVDTKLTPLFDASQVIDPTKTNYRQTDTAHPIDRINPPNATSDEYPPDLSEDAPITPTPGRLPRYASETEFGHAVRDVAGELNINLAYVPRENWEELGLINIQNRDVYTLERTIKAISPDDMPRVSGVVLRHIAMFVLEESIDTELALNRLKADAELVAFCVALAVGHGDTFTVAEIDERPDIGHWGQLSPAEVQERFDTLQKAIATVLSAFEKRQ